MTRDSIFCHCNGRELRLQFMQFKNDYFHGSGERHKEMFLKHALLFNFGGDYMNACYVKVQLYMCTAPSSSSF